MVHTYLWSIPIYDPYQSMVHTYLWSVPVVHTYLWSISTFDHYLPMVHTYLWSIPTYGDYLSMVHTYLWSIPTYCLYLPMVYTYLWSPSAPGRTRGGRSWNISWPSSMFVPGTFATNQCQNSAKVLKWKQIFISLIFAQTRSFCLFSSVSPNKDRYSTNFDIKGVLGIQTRNRKMLGTDEWSELWWPKALPQQIIV